MQTIGEILEFLRAKDTNIKEISNETGISSDRLYSWRKNRGTPKADDSVKLLEWAKSKWHSSKKFEEIQTETEFEQDYTHKYIKLLEDHNRELKEKVQANLETVLNNQLAQGSLFESFLRMMTDLLVQGGEREREQVRVNLHREAIQRLMVLKRKGMKIEIDNDDIVSGT